MAILEIIRQKLLSREYIYREHIYDKLEEINRIYGTNLTIDDVKDVILGGELIEILDKDERGTRYVIGGMASDDQTDLEIVCRIKNNLVIITVYVPYF